MSENLVVENCMENGNILYLEEKENNKPWVFIYKESKMPNTICSYACACLTEEPTMFAQTKGIYVNCFSSVLGNTDNFKNFRKASIEEIEVLYRSMHRSGYDFDFSTFETVEYQLPRIGDIIVRKNDKNDYCIIIYVNDDKFFITKPNANCFLTDGSPGLYMNHTILRDFYIDNEYFSKKFEPSEPFEKVLVRNDWEEWTIDLFSYKTDDKLPDYLSKPYKCLGGKWKYCITYNEKTKHLLGTQDFLKL